MSDTRAIFTADWEQDGVTSTPATDGIEDTRRVRPENQEIVYDWKSKFGPPLPPAAPAGETPYNELRAAVLRFAADSTDPRWNHAAVCALAEAHAQDSQDVDAYLADAQPAPSEATLRTLARETTNALFVNGSGDKAARLVLTAADGRDLGGWGRGPFEQRILAALQRAQEGRWTVK